MDRVQLRNTCDEPNFKLGDPRRKALGNHAWECALSGGCIK